MDHLLIPESELPSRPGTPWVEASPDSDDSLEWMTPSKCKPAAQVAEVLDKAEIPSLLWGSWAIATIGKFVISTSLVGGPAGDAHFHDLKHKTYKGPLRLHRKSTLIWWVPDPVLEHPEKDDSFFTLTNDPEALPNGRNDGPSGPWTGLYPIRILKPVHMTEALMFLECRDFKGLDFWMRWRLLLNQLLENSDNPNTYIKKTLRPVLQPYWEWLNGDEDHDINKREDFLKKIIAGLSEDHELFEKPEWGEFKKRVQPHLVSMKQ
ncbi:hypothetical protein N7512_003618 [Penicillium capsulatum]|nr:hypothetical protein N7512_003618 [Penicillium capsulatum]